MAHDIPAAQRKLIELAGRHQTELRSAIGAANSDAEAAYKRAGLHVGLRGDAALSELGHDLATIVQRIRSHADDLAVSHVLAELRAGVGTAANGISVSMPPHPTKGEVAEYITNCIDAAREAIKDVEAADRTAKLAETVYRAHTVIESEADSRYETARQACLHSLRSMTDEQARRLGFAIARSQDQFRSVEQLELRGDTEWIPIVGMRWDSRADACMKCRSAHDELRPLGFSFSLPGPGAHARCKCTTSLWILPFPTDRSVQDMSNAMADKTSHRVLREPTEDRNDRAGLAFNVRSLELRKENIDETTRTIRGAIASDESEDSHGSVIKAKGWDLESRFAANPVLLWNHPVGGWGERAEPCDVLGTVTATVKGKQLLVDLHFAPAEMNPKADQVFRMMTANPPIIRALSVGFAPTEYHFEKRGEGGDELLVIDEAQLYEVSVLPIGSNVNALARGLRALCGPSTGIESTQVVDAQAITGAGAAHACRSPSQETHMSTDNQELVQGVALSVLPAEIAARLGVDSIDKAVAAIDKRDLTIDKLTKDLAASEESRKALADKIEKRETEDTAAEVDALIKAGRIDSAKRDMALRSCKADRDAFRALYPAQEVAPQARKLEIPANLPADANTPAQPLAENPVEKRAAALIKDGKNYVEAWSQAMNEYQTATAISG